MNQVQIKEKPIIFSTEMVRAILNGSKRQTRRVIKPQPRRIDNAFDGTWEWKEKGQYYDDLTLVGEALRPNCPYGQVGQRLWVKETAMYWDGGAAGCSDVVYQDDPEWNQLLADNNLLLVTRELTNIAAGENVVGKWYKRPSLFMPRWASRIPLEILRVWVELLRSISPADAKAEGFNSREEFIETFLRLNHLPEDANPWNWAIEFRRLSE